MRSGSKKKGRFKFMKRFKFSTYFFVMVMVLGSLQLTALFSSDFSWGAEETNPATIQHVTRNMLAKGAKINKENLNLVARTVLEDSLRYGVDYRLILAIMKVESNFRQYIISPDGARGFMQIKPVLAGKIAKEAGIQYSSIKDLYDPQKNIRLGIFYISKLMDLFNDIPTVLFAYNVGHHKAKKLLATDKDPHTNHTKRVLAEYKRNTKKMDSL
jgi:soluble lytic murein transglycosylase